MNRIEYLFKVFTKVEPLLRSQEPFQRPTNVYIPGLAAQPWYEPQNFAWVQQLEEKYQLIQQELLDSCLADKNRFIPYQEPKDFFPDSIGNYDGDDWQTFPFSLYGKKFQENCDLCPVTTKILQSIPRITGMVHFSALTKRSHIPPHCGPFNFILRCQLPLIVPANCELCVAHKSRKLVEGKLLIFDDSFVHEAWNNSDFTRIILLFDLYHPDLTDAEIREFEFIITHDPYIQEVLRNWISNFEKQKYLSSIMNLFKSRTKKLHPYKTGNMILHSGLHYHQVAPIKAQPKEARITLQGHGIFGEGSWQLYW
ncbi:aspartyl/asparaginyl beta-hydroxylase domain-containing protein [Pleurocapsa sp. PCC 7319]|uniref:aspartyl/asparaginyl beta-hydroxylase domain-containing protein n=1 Tax=Pleurocapsa sp. PCC 7319 TaxID=118161 RepID=UPI00034B81F8|nr:aspartyl/asparaginyl beta-hydroxylase domain-containing protein [Pleurocapsa sp. PCC 7319]